MPSQAGAGIAQRLVLFALLTGFASGVVAHEVRPAYLQLTQSGETTFQMLFKVPAKGNLRLRLYPGLPDTCNMIDEPLVHMAGGAYVERATIHCSDGLTSGTISINGLSRVRTDALVRIERLDGNSQVVRLTPTQTTFTVEPSPERLAIARAYAIMGVEHILSGVDHLLFVLALLIVVGAGRRLVATITAFTIAHSITLACATLGLVRFPQQPIETVIALSIVFVAAEIVHIHQGRAGITRRWPWIAAFAFGLLHGFGFAGALSEVGLPQQAVPLALLLFNVGVEIGQLVFIAVIMLVLWVARRSQLKRPQWLELLPAYAIGTVAAYWTIERTVGLWG